LAALDRERLKLKALLARFKRLKPILGKSPQQITNSTNQFSALVASVRGLKAGQHFLFLFPKSMKFSEELATSSRHKKTENILPVKMIYLLSSPGLINLHCFWCLSPCVLAISGLAGAKTALVHICDDGCLLCRH
jgi:hypothetical protein